MMGTQYINRNKKSIAGIIIFIILAVPFSSPAISPFYLTGARSAGMGYLSLAIRDPANAFHNQALLAHLNGKYAGIHFENSFAIKELSTKSASFSMRTTSLGIGGFYSHFGYELYSESQVGFAIARKINDIFSLGIQLDYFRTSIAEGYGSAGTATGEIGLFAEPVEGLCFGAHLFNPASFNFGDIKSSEYELPLIFRFGMAYDHQNTFILSAEVEKTTDYEANLKFGAEYALTNTIMLRTGLTTKPVTNTFGIGLQFEKFRFDFAFSRHIILHYTTHLSIVYSIGNNS